MVFLEMTVSPGHAVPHSRMGTWLGVYAASHPGTQALDNVTVRIETDTDVQPDLALRKEPGTSTVEPEHILGAPELVIELAASSASYDLNRKKSVYERRECKSTSSGSSSRSASIGGSCNPAGTSPLKRMPSASSKAPPFLGCG
jgi:hypothetical protein